MLKNLVILISLIAVSRFIGLPANFSPLLALAVFMPRLSDDVRIQYLVPVSIVTFTNLFLDQVNIIIFATMLAVFIVTPITAFIILRSSQELSYKLYKYLFFSIGIFLIVISEISLNVISESLVMNLMILFCYPLLFIIINLLFRKYNKINI